MYYGYRVIVFVFIMGKILIRGVVGREGVRYGVYLLRCVLKSFDG